jgi:hypothetical protein
MLNQASVSITTDGALLPNTKARVPAVPVTERFGRITNMSTAKSSAPDDLLERCSYGYDKKSQVTIGKDMSASEEGYALLLGVMDKGYEAMIRDRDF